MTVPRFYCPSGLEHQVQIRLPERTAHHAAKVLRLQPGDRVNLFDGLGGEYQASIHQLDRDGVLLDVGRHLAVERESPLSLCLAQGLASGDKMDYIVQKAVQLGVSRVQPLATRKSVVKLNAERSERRQGHWANVVIAACEQCGRNRLPEVLPVLALADWLGRLEDVSTKLLLSPEGQIRLRALPRPTGDILLLAGPEGGLTQQETEDAVRAGFAPVQIGPRVLRTETAGLAAVAALQALWGDF